MIIKRLITWLIIIFFVCIVIIPFVWILISSFKTNIEFNLFPVGLPRSWTLENYIGAFSEEPLLLYLRNSIIVAISTALFATGIALLASYVFLFKFPLKNIFFSLCIFGIFLPLGAFMLPYYIIIDWLKLYDTLWGLITVYIGMFVPISFLIINVYMKEAVPIEVIEAAVLDGASFNQIFIKISVPMSRGGVISSIILLVIISWNEVLYAMLLSATESSRTAQVAILFLNATFSANYPMSFAAMMITIFPTILIYIFLNRHIVTGLAMLNK